MHTISLNSAPRTGNTFLGSLLIESINRNNFRNNILVETHVHDPNKLKINIPDQTLYTNLRDPLEVITSDFFMAIKNNRVDIVHGLENSFDLRRIKNESVSESIDKYIAFLEETIKQQHVKVISFNSLVNNPIGVIQKIFNDLSITLKVEPKVNLIIDQINKFDLKQDEGVPEYFKGYSNHLPHKKKDYPLYSKVEGFILESSHFNKLNKHYKRTLRSLIEQGRDIY